MEEKIIMKIHAIGLDMHHFGDFCIDRPNGSGDDLLIIFKTNAIITVDGEDIIAPPDSAVLYPIGAHQHYRTACNTYINHFLHFEGLDNDELRTALPLGRLIGLENIEEVEELLRMISREHMSDSANKEQYMDMLIKMLILKLSDCISDGISPVGKNPHSAKLNALRAEMYSSAGQFSSVEQLAQKLNFSPSHFQQLYKSFFGVSCYEDLLTAKIKMAQYYLRSTKLSVKEISAMCGYENDVCFMRQFKKRVGVTPTEYRSKTIS